MAKTKTYEFSPKNLGSPVETMLRNAICAYSSTDAPDVTLCDLSIGHHRTTIEFLDGVPRIFHPDDCHDAVPAKYRDWGDGKRHIYLYSDVLIGSYRADFVIATLDQDFLAIECDGHEWHERTKQQASQDRARDRALLRLGLPTIRFTGSDIVYNAHACAVEVVDIITAMQERSNDREVREYTAYERGKQDGLDRARADAAFDTSVERHRGIYRGAISELG